MEKVPSTVMEQNPIKVSSPLGMPRTCPRVFLSNHYLYLCIQYTLWCNGEGSRFYFAVNGIKAEEKRFKEF